MGTVEWTIENISYWNVDIHEVVISSPKNHDIHLELLPRGRGGVEGNFELHFVKDEYLSDTISRTIKGCLMPESAELIYSNSKKRAVTVQLENRGRFYQGPKFDEIVEDLRTNDPSRPDKLIVRCLMKNQFSMKCVSRIRVWDTSVKMSADTLKNLPFSKKEPILNITYIREDGGQDLLSVLASTFKDTFGMATVRLFLNPEFQDDVVSIRSYVSFPQYDGIPCVDGVADLLFHDGEVIQESGQLLVDKNASEDYVLRLKIAPGHNYQGIELSFPRQQKRKVPDDLDDSSLLKDLMCLYQDQDFSDFQLKCGNVSFPVHRNILSARSPVFKALLSCDMKEATSGRMDIEDLDASTLGLFLTYLYTGTMEEPRSVSALKLYYAADKYQVTALKRECTDILCVNVSMENLCEALSLADTHQDEELTSAVHNVILDNYNEVLGSEEWADLMRRDPFLASKTLTHFAKGNRVKKSPAQ